jgi:hypothetical protein
MFQALPHHLQQQPLLRIGLQNLARGHAEEGRVEPEYVIDDPRRKIYGLARHVPIGVSVAFGREPISGNLRHGAATFAQQLPELIRVECAWKPT